MTWLQKAENDEAAAKMAQALDLAGFAVIIDDTTGALTTAAQAAGASVLGKLGLGANQDMFQVVDQQAKDFAAKRGAELVGKRILEDGSIVNNPNAEWAITESTRDMIQSLLGDAIDNGWSVQQLKTELRDAYAFSNQRALMISRTEIGIAHKKGTDEGMRASGAANKKEWVEGSEHTEACECDDNVEQGLIDVDDDFVAGLMPHPNCSCSVIYRWVQP